MVRGARSVKDEKRDEYDFRSTNSELARAVMRRPRGADEGRSHPSTAAQRSARCPADASREGVASRDRCSNSNIDFRSA